MDGFETILVDTQDGVRTITLNRPEVLNAFNDRMLDELRQALREAERDEAVRCVVLTGAGRAFCSGQDLRARTEPFSFAVHLRTRYNPLILQLHSMEKPVLAAVNGVAAGAGCSLALACDLRIASTQAQFIEVFSRVGLVPDSGSTYFLPRLVGIGKAMELCLLADPLSAEEALRLGLVNWVVPPEELRERALAIASRLARGPTRAYGLTKRALLRSLQADLAFALDYEAMLQEIAGRTEDHREGLAAFFEKRPPRFAGR